MSEYLARIAWQRQPTENFLDNRYSRRHHWHFDGGAVVPGSSAPSSVPLPWSDPTAVDPEEAFTAALSSCHMLWFLYLAGKAGWCVDSYRDEAAGTMAHNGRGKLAMTRVTLRPCVVFGGEKRPVQADILHLHERAHDECYLANSVTTEVVCEPVWPA
jgi:organic hydroperoxide reductase OsmC/OhrA